MNILASSTPLVVLSVNCSVSIKGSTDWVMEFLTILSIAFIPREVKATSLRSFDEGLGIRHYCGIFTTGHGGLELENSCRENV